METGGSCLNFGLLDFGLLFLVFLYFREPLRRIEDTALLMKAWGWPGGEAWRQQMIRQYWMPPLIYTIFLVGVVFLYHAFKLPPEAPEWKKFEIAFWLWVAMIPGWPFVMCIRADRAYYRLEAWRRAGVEHRIAAGLASPADYYSYIQDVKEEAYNQGYSSGYSDGSFFK